MSIQFHNAAGLANFLQGSDLANLTPNISETEVTIACSVGTDATIPSATTSSAGVLTAKDFTKLDSIAVSTKTDTDISFLADKATPLLSPSYNQGTWTATQSGTTVTFSCTVAHNIPSSAASGVSGLGVSVYAKITNGAIKANLSDDGWYKNITVTGAQTFTATSDISVTISTPQAVTPSSSYVGNTFTFIPQTVTVPAGYIDVGVNFIQKTLFIIPSNTSFANITSRALEVRLRNTLSTNLTGHILSNTITDAATTSATFEANVTMTTAEADSAFVSVWSSPTGVRSTSIRVATGSNISPIEDTKLGVTIVHTAGLNDWCLLVSNSAKFIGANVHRDTATYLPLPTPVTVPNNFFGIHAANWPVNVRPNKTVTASGTAGANTVTLSSADASITAGMTVVTQNDSGTAIGATVVSNVGTTLTFGSGQNNTNTFAGKTLEISGLTTSLGSVNSVDPSVLGYSMFRTHDLGVVAQWYSLNPAPGIYYWDTLDTVVSTVRGQGRDILFTIMGTPKWASARPLETGYAWGGRGHGAEPANMQHLADFVVALQTRYAFNYLEWLNEPNFMYVTKVCSGTTGGTTITSTTDTNGFPDGATVTGPGIPPYTTVLSRSGNVITLKDSRTTNTPISLTADLSGTTVMFSGATSHFYSGTEAKAAEGMRIVNLAAKSVTPTCKVMGLAISNILATPTSTSWPMNYYTASAAGMTYLGNSGTGTTAVDWMDIIAVHSYQGDFNYGNRVFSQLKKMKDYMAANGMAINKEFWTTEFGVNRVTGFGGLVTTTCSAGDSTVTITTTAPAPAPATNALSNKWLRKTDGTRVGFIVSNTSTTITLAEPAYVALTGTSMIYDDNEVATVISRNILCMAAAGFARAFWYQWGQLYFGIDTKPAVYAAVAANVAAIKGKTVVAVREDVIDGAVTLKFSDNTTLTV